MAKRRKPRLIKKLHLGEFTEFGFECSFTCPPDAEFEILAAMTAEVLRARDMAFLYQGKGSVFISGSNGSVSEDDRTAVENWISERRTLDGANVGPLVDAWHPPRGVKAVRHRPCKVIHLIRAIRI